MPCYNPTRTIQDAYGRPNWGQDWRYAAETLSQTMNVPCRHCVGCAEAKAREWSVRCFHEAQLYTEDWTDPDTQVTTTIPNSSVITLTYRPEHLPPDGLLNHRHFQDFMRRLRRSHNRDSPIRYFMCGEYGGLTARPHFHAIIFNESFSDQYQSIDRNGQIQNHSYELDRLWSRPEWDGGPVTNVGRATVDAFTFAGAGYVAGYIAKKSTIQGDIGPISEKIDLVTGDVTYTCSKPEYRRMSLHPGLGHDWLIQPQNLSQVYPSDKIQISQWVFHPPKYYDKVLKRTPGARELHDQVVLDRRAGAHQYSEDWSLSRCAAAEIAQINKLQLRRDSL